MKHLAKWQSKNSDAVIAMRIITDRYWPVGHYKELDELGLDTSAYSMPWLGCGTINFMSHLCFNPVNGWVKEIEHKYQPDTLFILYHNAWLSGSYLPVTTKKARLLQVCTFHGISDLHKLRSRSLFRALHAGLAKRLPKFAVRLVSVDNANTAIAEEVFGLRRDSFSVVPNGLCVKTDNTSTTFKISGPFTVGFVGLLTAHKGWRVLAEAVIGVAAQEYHLKTNLPT